MGESMLRQLMKAPTPEEMRVWDEAAINFGIPENILMEAAGMRLFEFLDANYQQAGQTPVCLFMGGGNNGGDAACLARHLHDNGFPAMVYHTGSLASRKGACAYHADLALRDGVPFSQMTAGAGASSLLKGFVGNVGRPPAVIVDGLLGTGFAGQLRPDMANIIAAINELRSLCGAFMISIDIPSGMNGATGEPSPSAITADVTITLAAPKTGLLMPAAVPQRGKLLVRPIGLPAAIAEKCPASARLLDGRILQAPPHLPANSYKNVYGHVFVLGGARGFTGAAHLSASAALKAGAGLVTACAPADSLAQIKGNWPEIMTLSVSTGHLWPSSLDQDTEEALRNASAIVIGPGLGRSEDSAAFLRAFLHLPNRPATILDADALILISRDRSLLYTLREEDILTPHPGEAGALLGISSRDVQKNRLDAINRLCDLAPSVFSLKGAGTIIGQRGHELLISPYDIPQLAIGGAGDVLSGIIGALAGMGETSLDAAAQGVATHAVAGLICARKYPCRGALASDIAAAAPEVSAFLSGCGKGELGKGIVPWPC